MADLYKGKDPRDLPAYSVPEAAHYLYVPEATLRSWAVGRMYPTSVGKRYFEPLITVPEGKPRLLTFTNLVEAHVLAAIRRKHGVTLPNVRSAIDHLRSQYDIEHPLADARFKTDGLSLFIEVLDQLVNVSMRGQTAIREIMEAHLERVEHDEKGLAARLFPFTRYGATDVSTAAHGDDRSQSRIRPAGARRHGHPDGRAGGPLQGRRVDERPLHGLRV